LGDGLTTGDLPGSLRAAELRFHANKQGALRARHIAQTQLNPEIGLTHVVFPQQSFCIRLYIKLRAVAHYEFRFIRSLLLSGLKKQSMEEMSFRVRSRDEVAGTRPLDPEIGISASPRRSEGHSRHQSESRHLLPSPKNLFEYSATSHFRFPDNDVPALVSRQSDSGFPDWSFDPQSLRRSRRQWWRDLFLDILMMAIGLPFIALAGAVIRVNGRVTGEHELNILEQCIRGVSFILLHLPR
jgi:hypothetical protein